MAIDAFGSDRCPEVEIEAAVLAARAGHRILLVGDEARLHRGLARFDNLSALPLEIRHAPAVITMEDSPGKAIRAKPDASMPTCFELVRRGEAAAVVSAGNSGAMLACGLFKFGRIKGVDRPAIVSSIPGPDGACVLLDMGANVECRPLNLVQFAVMGATFAAVTNGRSSPVVGILANGAEEGKGTELTRAAHRLLRDHPSPAFTYRGYVEGSDLFSGELDVVVTDGFTGNIALKAIEATARALIGIVRQEVEGRRLSQLGALLMRPSLSAIKRRMDPDNYGGAPLLGVDGIAIICHGGSTPRALVSAIDVAASYVDRDLTPGLREAVRAHRELFAAAKADAAKADAAKIDAAKIDASGADASATPGKTDDAPSGQGAGEST
ncbi:MAG: phosphate acyltransferase PlsX [Myxococcales bacterium]|nr:phosphate acyltransferase PlsX [Myxococcales bacterium]